MVSMSGVHNLVIMDEVYDTTPAQGEMDLKTSWNPSVKAI
jgi:hypothetical protein